METMVILWCETEDCDVAIMFRQFIILDQCPDGEFTALDPVGGDLADGVHDGTGVCGGDDPDGFFGGVDGSGAGFQFTEEEFVECFVAIQFGD